MVPLPGSPGPPGTTGLVAHRTWLGLPHNPLAAS